MASTWSSLTCMSAATCAVVSHLAPAGSGNGSKDSLATSSGSPGSQPIGARRATSPPGGWTPPGGAGVARALRWTVTAHPRQRAPARAVGAATESGRTAGRCRRRPHARCEHPAVGDSPTRGKRSSRRGRSPVGHRVVRVLARQTSAKLVGASSLPSDPTRGGATWPMAIPLPLPQTRKASRYDLPQAMTTMMGTCLLPSGKQSPSPIFVTRMAPPGAHSRDENGAAWSPFSRREWGRPIPFS